MGSEQSDTYGHAIQEYRAACQARGMKSSNGVHSNLINLLPKRQISNYFTQFRKVHYSCCNI
jgi:SWI/SNF-related matrix-associated actin-dependent regulator of chromatin subfamily A containing DEAD/H box 1